MKNFRPYDGPTLVPVNLLPSPLTEHPTWCDVYVDGKLIFQNVFVQIKDDCTLFLYNSYWECKISKQFEPRLCHRVAIVKSDNYWIIGRKQ